MSKIFWSAKIGFVVLSFKWRSCCLTETICAVNFLAILSGKLNWICQSWHRHDFDAISFFICIQPNDLLFLSWTHYTPGYHLVCISNYHQSQNEKKKKKPPIRVYKGYFFLMSVFFCFFFWFVSLTVRCICIGVVYCEFLSELTL